MAIALALFVVAAVALALCVPNALESNELERVGGTLRVLRVEVPRSRVLLFAALSLLVLVPSPVWLARSVARLLLFALCGAAMLFAAIQGSAPSSLAIFAVLVQGVPILMIRRVSLGLP